MAVYSPFPAGAVLTVNRFSLPGGIAARRGEKTVILLLYSFLEGKSSVSLKGFWATSKSR